MRGEYDTYQEARAAAQAYANKTGFSVGVEKPGPGQHRPACSAEA